jgi:putative ABC transport system substrate-binding protein
VKRREFITLLGGAALACALAAQAQQRERMRRIGMVTGFSEPEMRPLATAFRMRLRELGWFEDRDVIIDVRASAGGLQQIGGRQR